MKKLLIPVIIAVLAGVGGGSGFSYMRVSKQFVVDSAHRADSLKLHPPADSASQAPEADAHAADPVVETDSTAIEAAAPLTPADSIRALEAARTSLRASTKGVPNAAPVAHLPADAHAEVKPGAPSTAKSIAESKPAVTKSLPKAPESALDTPTPADGAKGTPTKSDATTSAASAIRSARNDAMSAALPEQRLAKIFGVMSPKDAAKVMDQMPDSDVRTILSMMSDRNAAAILTQFSATRAAAITKGAMSSGVKTP